MKRVFLLTFLFYLLMLSAVYGQSHSSSTILHETLIENEQLNVITQFIQTDSDAAPVLNAIATIDRVNRQITIEYKNATANEESSSLYTYDEQGRPVSYVSYTITGQQKNNERYSYDANGSVTHRSMWQDTAEDIPEAERWTRLQTVNYYDEHNNIVNFTSKGIRKGKSVNNEGKYTYSYDKEERKVEKISMHQDDLSGDFTPFIKEEWEYSKDKVRHTLIQLKSGKKEVTTSWYEEDLLVKEKRRSDEENSTTLLTYENGLLTMKHLSGSNELGDLDIKWIYEYK